MGKFIDLTGQKFSKLTVIKIHGKNKNGGYQWLCQCDCNKQTVVASGHLKSGHTKSCGCLNSEGNPESLNHEIKHGHSRRGQMSKIYHTWKDMKTRCLNSNHKHYQYYGGRGIKICQRWLKFENFLEDMREKPDGLTLDRIDNNGNYCKENCRWATRKEQQRNMRSNKYYTINNVTKCLAEWCYQYDLPRNTVAERIKRGLTPEEALGLINSNHKTIHYFTWNNKTLSIRQWCIKLKLKSSTVYRKIRKGMSYQQALGLEQ